MATFTIVPPPRYTFAEQAAKAAKRPTCRMRPEVAADTLYELGEDEEDEHFFVQPTLSDHRVGSAFPYRIEGEGWVVVAFPTTAEKERSKTKPTPSSIIFRGAKHQVEAFASAWNKWLSLKW